MNVNLPRPLSPLLNNQHIPKLKRSCVLYVEERFEKFAIGFFCSGEYLLKVKEQHAHQYTSMGKKKWSQLSPSLLTGVVLGVSRGWKMHRAQRCVRCSNFGLFEGFTRSFCDLLTLLFFVYFRYFHYFLLSFYCYFFFFGLLYCFSQFFGVTTERSSHGTPISVMLSRNE